MVTLHSLYLLSRYTMNLFNQPLFLVPNNKRKKTRHQLYMCQIVGCFASILVMRGRCTSVKWVCSGKLFTAATPTNVGACAIICLEHQQQHSRSVGPVQA